MRVSTSMLFDSNVRSLNDKSAALLKTQQQVSSGKRILTPSDDPVAAAQVLELTQSASVNTQYQSSQTAAQNNLGLIDNQLSSVSDLLGRIRELGVQAGDAALSTADRKSISTELRSDFDQLMSIANSTDGNGKYLFSGYQSTNQPFAGSVENGVTYSGDDGQRAVRVSGSRLMPVSAAGNDIFMNAKDGNGVFVTAAQTQRSANTGTASIDAGTVTDPVKWTSSANPGKVNVSFWTDTTGAIGAAGATYYDLVDAGTGKSLFTGAASATGAGGSYTTAHAYTSGASIPLSNVGPPAFDFGASVTVSGTPASGDTFVLTSGAGSASNSYFSTSPLMTASSNSGSALIDAGAVSDPTKWNNAANSGQLQVRFWQDPATSSLYYDLVDATDGKSLFTGTSSTTGAGGTFTHAYTSGNAISFSGLAAPYNDFGASVTVTGTPAGGDSFTVNRSGSNGLFSMLSNMINAVETPSVTGPAGNTQMQNQLSSALTNLSQVEDNVLRVRADVGSRLTELTSLGSSSQNLDTQYQTSISSLQSVDYNKAITDLTQQQTQLQATQQSFVKIAGLSLFNYLT